MKIRIDLPWGGTLEFERQLPKDPPWHLFATAITAILCLTVYGLFG